MNKLQFWMFVKKMGNVFMLLCLLLLNSGLGQIVQATSIKIVRVPIASDNVQGNGDSYSSSISADGRYVAYYSSDNSFWDVFIHDRQTWQTTRVSIDSNGAEGNGNSFYPSISANGRYVAFSSYAKNLVSGDTNNALDIFVHNMQTGQITRVSVDSNGIEGNGDSLRPSISADGRYVAFDSHANNLIIGDLNGKKDVFVHDIQTGQTTRVSVDSYGWYGDSGTAPSSPSISADGRYIAFDSSSSNLIDEDTNGVRDVFVHENVGYDNNVISDATVRYSETLVSGWEMPNFDDSSWQTVVAPSGGLCDPSMVARIPDSTALPVWGQNPQVNQTIYARKTFSLQNQVSAIIKTLVDDDFDLYVNGALIRSDWNGQWSYFEDNISLQSGLNLIAIKAIDTFGGCQNIAFDVVLGQELSFVMISGNAGIPSATLSYTDGISKSVLSDSNGDYIITVPEGWSGTVTPSRTGYTFSPPNLPYTNVQTDQTNQNYTSTKLKPPLIIVHGFQGLAFDGLIPKGYHCTNDGHGADDVQLYNGTNSTLGDLPQMFYHDYEVWIAHLETTPLGTPSLETNAQCLRDQIKYVAAVNPQPITIVAHSMGGVVSRAAIRYLDNPKEVKALYTLGSPHAGIPIEILALQYPKTIGEICLIHLGGCQMATTSMVNFNTWNLNVKDVQYNFIAGNGGTGIFDWYLRLNFQGPNDGLVGQYSAVGWVYQNQIFEPSSWVSNSIPGQFFTNETHPNKSPVEKAYYVYQDGQGFSDSFGCIDALIKDNTPDPSHCWPAGTQAPQVNSMKASALLSSVSSFTEVKTGHLDAGQTVILPFVIDSTSTTLFYLNWSGGNTPSFTLTRPDAQVINPAYAAAHPAEVTYEISSGSPEAAPAATYSFVSGQVGTWQAIITATDAVDYKVFGLIDSTLQLTANTNAEVYQIGNVATITANLANGGTGVTGATVIAELTRSDAIVNTISLTSQGNGAYSNTYTIPDASGYLTIDVTASGNDSGTAFSRQENLLVAIAPNDLQLTGNYGDQPRDDNSDGFYDFLDFTAEVNLASPGEYVVSAELYAGDQLITQSGDFFDLSAGIQTIILPFDGGAIREAGLNGPYTVKNLYFTPIDIGITAASVENVWTTQAYSYTQFANTTYTQVSFLSSGVEDGWILESSETSGKGGKLNKPATTLRVGDDATNKQYRSILSFDTSTLPEGAVITSVTLKFKHAGISGTNPFNTHGKLLVDICEGAFKNNPALQLGDFNAKCLSGFYKAKALIYSNTKVDNWYSQSLLPDNFQFINLEGMTQFRLRFAKDDNNDFGADFLKIFSGNALNEADRPQLVIQYYVP